MTIEVIDATLGSLGTTTSTTGGAWTLTLGTALGEGSYSLTANATDAAGNPGPASAAVDVTVDTTAPDAPVDNRSNSRSTTEHCYIRNIRYRRRRLTVEVFDGTTSLGTTTADSSGAWTLTLGTELGEGTTALLLMLQMQQAIQDLHQQLLL